jgi:hypothetical protein
VTNAERILHALDSRLNGPVELTLYGRAAFALGFPDAPDDYAWSKDVDAVLWLGQAELLDPPCNFWEALDVVNQELTEEGLYMTHLFDEDQVILRENWRDCHLPVPGSWAHLRLFRLHDLDLLLSKCMRYDPIDLDDARFVIRAGGLDREAIEGAIAAAKLPAIPEIHEQFALCTKALGFGPDPTG